MQLPVVDSAWLTPFLLTLEHSNAPIDAMLDAVKVPRLARKRADLVIAEPPLWAFVDLASKSGGDDGFGFQVAHSAGLETMGAFSLSLARTPTLRHIAAAFTDVSPGSGFCVRSINKRLCFARSGSGIKRGAWPVEQYVLTIMIQALRYLIGGEWTPDEVFLQAPQRAHQLRGLEQSAYLAGATIHTGQACTAIAIPSHVGTPSAISNPESAPGSSVGTAAATGNLESSLRQVLTPYLSGGYPNEGLAAEICGTSIRTLRRRLHDAGTSYREVVASVRFHAARQMLADRQMKLIDIAYALGYQDPGSFSRAFHAWTGLPPSAYRRAKAST